MSAYMGPRAMDPAAEQALRARAKQELRGRMRSLRRVLPHAACAERSAAVCARLCELAAFANARTLIGYFAYQKETDPAAALRAAEQAHKTVGLVRVEDGGGLGLHRHREGDAVEHNDFGIAEPLAAAERIAYQDVDLVIVPALAIDARGHRIGYGQGYYDRLLPKLTRAFKIAIAYDFQLLLEAPSTQNDVAVDCVVTDKRTLMTGT
jgi:5-formyltetrahydrofolate cyclo-ligase